MEIVRINFVGKCQYKEKGNCILCNKTINEPNYELISNKCNSKIHKSKCGCLYHNECYEHNKICKKHNIELEIEHTLDSETFLPIKNKYTNSS